ncbi:fam-c protein [Plasmodium berghei]|uniref:Fam-c protein n=2 Tax=Plasmodium berghei TaxID=5821 RepID=A0A509AEE7_PLABA|nr:fam-c protein [Plasmodium berghei ANKA]CXH19986.1 fam-c protein [Plasmodium berghei]SBW38331.1 fam-c protein [Plasmodium berghei]SCL83627.1 fam-c protein [Plasmodium berghei]SCL86536.1 fam-c protein [Plasmodium berghei]SCL86572.1 fam-c protein [Plasmodium berghei]|eukprot:XP_034419601.1 fam-c protein [Plasmodium berghei ANKA]
MIAIIQCFTNNDDLNKYVKKNKNAHDEHEINSIDINNNEHFRYRSISEYNIEDNYSFGSITIQEFAHNKKSNCFNIFKRDKKTKKSSNANGFLSKVALLVGNVPHNFPVQSPEHYQFLLNLKNRLDNHPSNLKLNE